jgi:hypothetical protein
MQHFAVLSAVALFGAGLGWIALFSGVVAPVSFKDMDHGRADRHVRRVIKSGHGPLALLCALGAVAALLGQAVAAAAVGALAAGVFLLSRWALAPRTDERPPPGGKRKLQTARIVAAAFTASMAPVLIAAIVLAGLGI